MNNLRTLILLELASLFGINKFLNTKDKKEKNNKKLIFGVWIFLIIMIFSYISGYVYTLCYLGLEQSVMTFLVFISSLLVFFFGIFKSANTLFEKKGYDILFSLPTKASEIVVSRFFMLYLEDFLFSLLILLPGVTVYGILQSPNITFYIISFISCFFIPIIPLVLSVLVGTFITFISSRMKYKSIIQIFLTLLFVILILCASFGIDNFEKGISSEKIVFLIEQVSTSLKKIYIPSHIISDACYGKNILGFVIFIFASIVSVLIAVLISTAFFHQIMQQLFTTSAKHNYKITTLKSNTTLKTLYFRELKRYFSSSIYVTNTIIGPIMGLIMSVAVLVVGFDKITSSIPENIPVLSLIPFLLSSVFCMMTATSVSVSMEGRCIDTVKSLPISSKALFDGKILMNFSVILPFYVLSEIFLLIEIKPSFYESIWFILIPLLIIVLSLVFGIFINIKSHRFDWEKEEQIVKQSLSSAVGGFFGFFVSIILGYTVFLVPEQYGFYVKSIICAIIILIIILLYKENNKTKLTKL